jgi:hypothetical protein
MITKLVYCQTPYDEKYENYALGEDTPWADDKMEDKPETERKLFEYQEEYLRTRKTETWKKMFHLCYDYARSLVLKRLKGKVYIDPEEVDDYSITSTLAFMRQYLIKPYFRVGASFAGMIKWKVIESMYRYQKEDHNESLNAVLDSNTTDKTSELQDNLEKIGFTPMQGSYSRKPDDLLSDIDLKDIVDEVINEMLEMNLDEYTTLIILFRLVIIFKKPKNRHIKINFQDRWERDFKVYSICELSEKEIKARFKEMLYTDNNSY